MALTIQFTPAAYSSVQNDLLYTVAETVKTADPVTYPNYKFVGDVYIGAVMVARLKIVPNPTTNIGIFNIAPIVRSYIAATFNPANTILAQSMGDSVFNTTVTMKFGEEYSYTTYTNITVDSARTFFNNYNPLGQDLLTPLINKVLSNRPYSTPISTNYNLIPFFPTDTDGITLTIKTYDYSNSLVTTYDHNETPVAFELLVFNLSKDAINLVSPGLINDSIKYFTVLFATPNISDDVTYKFIPTCEAIYEIYTVHFLNKFGGFESKDFSKVSRKTISINKKDFGKLPYIVDSSGLVTYKNSNGVYNESKSVYSSQFQEKLTLNSDLLTDDEYTWLEELVLSPMVYLQDGSNFYPVVITETNYEAKKNINDDLTNLTISLEYGVTNNAQYR